MSSCWTEVIDSFCDLQNRVLFACFSVYNAFIKVLGVSPLILLRVTPEIAMIDMDFIFYYGYYIYISNVDL